MTKFLNKWLRKTHRWFSVPTFLSIPLMLFVKITKGAYFILPPGIEMAQQFLIFYLALSGTYLFFIPYIVKSQHNKRKKEKITIAIQEQ